MRATPSMMSDAADHAALKLKKLLAQTRGITEIVALLYSSPKSCELVEKHIEAGTPINTARLSKYLIQHPNIESIKLGDNERAPRVFIWTATKEQPYQNRPESETYVLPHKRS